MRHSVGLSLIKNLLWALIDGVFLFFMTFSSEYARCGTQYIQNESSLHVDFMTN